jgi:8-oxo-dGTP diphosphatase
VNEKARPKGKAAPHRAPPGAKKKRAPSVLRRPALTADVVLFAMRAGDLAVLLVRRRNAPFQGAWALPGGFVEHGELLERAAWRELQEETGLTPVPLEQLGAFGDPGRDPRGHTVSVVFFSFLMTEARPLAGDDASDARWFPLEKLPKRLAFDHASIIEHARRRLQARLLEPMRETPFALVPSHFTLTELQRVYEAVLGRSLDKRNFRAKILAQNVVELVGIRRVGRHRPAQLYRWSAPDAVG